MIKIRPAGLDVDAGDRPGGQDAVAHLLHDVAGGHLQHAGRDGVDGLEEQLGDRDGRARRRGP